MAVAFRILKASQELKSNLGKDYQPLRKHSPTLRKHSRLVRESV